jgi:hypothetical protein
MSMEVAGNYWNFFAKCILSIVPLLTASFASFLHLIVISVDRYIALAYPIWHRVHVTKGYASFSVSKYIIIVKILMQSSTSRILSKI